MSRDYAPSYWKDGCREWTLFALLPNGDIIGLTGGLYRDVRSVMAAYRISKTYSALAVIRDIPLGPPYPDGSQDSRWDRVAASLAFETHGYGMSPQHYWER